MKLLELIGNAKLILIILKKLVHKVSEFKWFYFWLAMDLLKKMLDPNPNTRISV